MNKKVVMMLIKNQEVKQEDFIQFILDYLKFKGKPEPTAEQIPKLLQVFSMGIFSLKTPLEEAIKHLNLQVIRLYDKSGKLLKIDVYDN